MRLFVTARRPPASLRLALMPLLLGLLSASVGAREELADDGPVLVVVTRSEADVFRIVDGTTRALVEVPEPLLGGTTIEIAGSTHLVWMDGRRFEVFPVQGAATCQVEFGPDGPVAHGGRVFELESVPAVAGLQPLLRAEAARRRAAAARIRSAETTEDEIGILEPLQGSMVSARSVKLRFDQVEGADRYRVQVEDEDGTTVWSGESRSTEIQLPEDLLQPDRAYFWRVAAEPRSVWRFGEALFFTLDKSTLETLEAIKSSGPEDVQLLAQTLLASQ